MPLHQLGQEQCRRALLHLGLLELEQGGAQVRRERPPELEVVRRVVERRAHQHPLVDFDALAHAARSPPMRPLSSCSMSPTAAQANGTECSAGRRSPSSDAPIRSTIAADCCSSWWARSDCATVMPVWTADRLATAMVVLPWNGCGRRAGYLRSRFRRFRLTPPSCASSARCCSCPSHAARPIPAAP